MLHCVIKFPPAENELDVGKNFRNIAILHVFKQTPKGLSYIGNKDEVVTLLGVQCSSNKILRILSSRMILS